MKSSIPVIFSDGTAFFSDLSKDYIHHKEGYFILAPSGSGKTFFTNKQTQRHWIDGDVLWPMANADNTEDSWTDSFDLVMEVNNKCDVITNEARKLGFWVVGSSNNFLKPDAIVLPEWILHKKHIIHREQQSYDGGAKK